LPAGSLFSANGPEMGLTESRLYDSLPLVVNIHRSNHDLMNKAELVAEVQKTLGDDASKESAEKAVKAVLESIIKGVKKDKNVQLIGFGTFTVTKRAARTGVNPQTGEKMKIKASKSVKFKPGATLKDAA
jgi:nucleoid DNA-binding protein